MTLRNRPNTVGIFFVALLIALSSGCSGGNINPGGNGEVSASTLTPAISVSLSESRATVLEGATTQFAAIVTNDAADKGVTWTVSCLGGPCGSVSPTSTASGALTTYTPPSSPAGNLVVTVTAASVADSTKSASVTVTVPALTVSLTPVSDTVQAAATAQFAATVAEDGANKGVTWAVSCSAAPCGSVSPNSTASGVATTYTAPAAPTASRVTVTITATSLTDRAKTASATITVTVVISISITPSSASVPSGGTQQFTATVNNDPNNGGVTWQLFAEFQCIGLHSSFCQFGNITFVACNTCGTVSPTSSPSGATVTYTPGNFTPPSEPDSKLLGIFLRATSVTDGTKTASATITVTAGINVSPSTASVEAGATQQFTATVANDPTNSGVTWTLTESGNPCSPVCGAITPSTTASGVAATYSAPAMPAGNLAVTVTATSVALSSESASATVTVLAITISAAPGSALLPVNMTQQFSATVSNDPNTKGVSWTLIEGGVACSPGCGTVAPSNTASGSPTTYTAPAAVPTSSTVTITAASVADPTKTANASVTITAGTVKLVPNSLDFGRELARQTSAPQVATLTDTGSTTLKIAGVTITGSGTNASDYSQTNACNSSLGAGMSCAITVTFTPTTMGTFTANVSIADSSTDSPQQVRLRGVGYTTKGAVASAAAPSALTSSQTAVPSPTGPNNVGTREMDLVDSARIDPFLANGTKRELLVRFWYPASVSQACKPADYTSSRVWNYFSELLGIPLPAVTTNSCLDAPGTDGAHPIVVFTPGYTGTFTDYTFLFEDLASRGYIVASIDHTYEATAVEFPDGRFVKSVLGSHLGNTWRGDEPTFSFAMGVRLSDLKFVIDELQRLNVQASSPFVGNMDLSRIAVAGHSMGGSTAMLAVEQEQRFKAGIVIDGVLPESLVSPTETPVLLLAAGREQWSDAERQVWGQLQGARFAVNLKGAEHVTPTDEVWLASDVIKTGTMGPAKTIAALRSYIAAFLDTNLLGRPTDSLLAGPSSDYPDAEVTTQTELLGAKQDTSRAP